MSTHFSCKLWYFMLFIGHKTIYSYHLLCIDILLLKIFYFTQFCGVGFLNFRLKNLVFLYVYRTSCIFVFVVFIAFYLFLYFALLAKFLLMRHVVYYVLCTIF